MSYKSLRLTGLQVELSANDVSDLFDLSDYWDLSDLKDIVSMTPPKFLPIRGALTGASAQQNSPVNIRRAIIRSLKTISLVRALHFRAAREYTTVFREWRVEIQK